MNELSEQSNTETDRALSGQVYPMVMRFENIMHDELMKNIKLSRSEYLSALRKQQPISELRRKAEKAQRKDIFTQEELDLACVECAAILIELFEFDA